MKRNRISLSWDPKARVIQHPAVPYAGFELLHKLRCALSSGYGGKLLPLEHMAFLLRIPLSTSHDWFRTAPLAQVQALLCLLERLPANEWQQILNKHLREFPRLAEVCPDPTQQRELERLIIRGKGLTLIQGGSSRDRNYLITALGHAFHRIDPLHRNPGGLDVRDPETFVPVAGLLYFKPSLPAEHLRSLLTELWLEVKNSTPPLLIINGVFSVSREVLPSIINAASARHVLIADDDPALRGQIELVKPRGFRILQLSKAGPGFSPGIHVSLG